MGEISKTADKIIIRPNKDIVSSTVNEFKNELKLLLKESPKEIEIDMSGVGILDSLGIAILIQTHNSLQLTGRTLKITNVSSGIFKLFSIIRLTHHFEIENA